MKKCFKSLWFCKCRSAISVLLVAALLVTIELPAAAFSLRSLSQRSTESRLSPGDINLSGASATVSGNGVLLRWSTNYEIDNLGFNVYRLKNYRTRVNREIIPGSIFIVGDKTPLLAGYSYSFFDAGGNLDSIYYIEAVSTLGRLKQFEPVRVVARGKLAARPDALAEIVSAESNSSAPSSSQREYPAGDNIQTQATGPIEDQWELAAQPGLKIFVKKDGWYRVTQQQAVAAGFVPSVDIRNLLLYVEAQELAIRTSKSSGQFSNGDYFEFYGKGLDTATTDSRTYYLVAGTREGKRMLGEVRIDAPEVLAPPLAPPVPQPVPHPVPQTSPEPSQGVFIRPWFNFLFRFLNGTEGYDEPKRMVGKLGGPPEKTKLPELTNSAPEFMVPSNRGNVITEPVGPVSPVTVSSPVNDVSKVSPGEVEPTIRRPARQQSVGTRAGRKKKSKRKTSRIKKIGKIERSHAAMAAAAPSFNFTVERKDRKVYFGGLLNGDTENFFGSVIASSSISQTITTLNPDPTAPGPAKLEIALQGINFVTHQVNVFLNDIAIGTMTYFGRDRKVQIMDVPVSVLHNGDNTLRFVSTVSGATSLVDYARLTYPHAFRADNNSLRFSLRSNQSATIDGFSTPNLILIDYTDPFSVKVIKPINEISGSGYAFTVAGSVVRSKFSRLLYVVPEGQPEQPAGFALNQPSTLNQSSNGADLLIISHKNFIPNVAPLADLRRSQGLTVSVVDVEDVYDEFSFGAHGPQGIRDFLARAKANWTTAPRYVIFAGDASLDPRNYTGGGYLDFVPTKLVDATYNETASDDWLSDFDDDGIADIPVGRLPVRTSSETALVISKITSFSPADVPQSALLVADDPTNYYFNFEHSNDEVQTLVSPSLTVHRVNRRTEPSDSVARANINARFNQGVALVNYTGHGNVNVWTAAPIFDSSDALALNNGNRLPLVVVMDCLNGYFHDPLLEGIAESLLKAPNGGAVAAFASSGLTLPDGQHEMSQQLYILLYGSQSIPLGDAIKTAKAATNDMDVRRTWIFFGDPSMRIR